MALLKIPLNRLNLVGPWIGPWVGLLLGSASLVFAQEVQVLPWLKTDLKDLTLSERGKLLQFLTEVDRLAPVRLKQSVESPLSLIFSAPLGDEEHLPDPCEATVPFTLGHSQLSQKKIVMSRLLRREILKGPGLATRFSCGHQNYYRFAQAVLLHELTHFFDHSPSTQNQNQKFSDSKQFKYMTGWDLQGLGIRHWTQSNRLASRSPDPYEFKSPEEALAVFMEFFLLDPDFQCRKPALYSYLSERLGHTPFPQSQCRMQTQIPVSSLGLEVGRVKWVDLNPQRVYQIHYLFASQGQTLMSHWGHSMIRVVLCNPQRAEVGPACLEEDVANHIVLSYRANLEEPNPSPWKMLTQDIPSQLFVLPLTDVVNEYTRDELRDLVSMPLQFSEAEKTAFIHHTLEQFWSFKGSYSLLQQNCATLALQHIKSALSDERIDGMKDFHSMTPLKLYQRCARRDCDQPEEWRQLFDSQARAKDPKLAERRGFLFKSKVEQLNNAFDELKKGGKSFPFANINDYMHVSTASQRMEAFQQVMANVSANLSTPLKTGARFFILEAQILRFLRIKYFNKITANLGQNREKYSGLVEKYQEVQSSLQPWRLVRRSYGVPTEPELNPESMTTVIKDSEKSFESHKELIEQALAAFTDIREQIENSTQNALEFRKTITGISFMNVPASFRKQYNKPAKPIASADIVY